MFQHVVLPGSSARCLFHMSAFSSEPGQALLTSLFIKAFPCFWLSMSTKLSPCLQELSRQRANTHELHLASASSRAGWVGAPGAPAAAVQRRQMTLPHCCRRLSYVRRQPAPPGRRRSCAPAMPPTHVSMYLSSRGRRAQMLASPGRPRERRRSSCWPIVTGRKPLIVECKHEPGPPLAICMSPELCAGNDGEQTCTVLSWAPGSGGALRQGRARPHPSLRHLRQQRGAGARRRPRGGRRHRS